MLSLESPSWLSMERDFSCIADEVLLLKPRQVQTRGSLMKLIFRSGREEREVWWMV